jgi:sortase A
VGTLRIPSIGLDENVRSGVAPRIINSGVAHWVGTAGAGEPGNVVLAGHRTTHTRPFNDLDLLQPGDLVYMTDARGFEVMYRVSNTFIVDPEDIWITFDQGSPMLTMFACHPKGSKRFRIVVQADLVGRRPLA